MPGESVTIAALGIVASIAAALIWLLKKLFVQNDTTIKELTQVLKELKDTLHRDDSDRKQFQDFMMATMSKVSEKQDIIYDTINTTNMTVQNLYISHEKVTKEEE